MGELIVSGGDAAPILEPAETALDDIALLVSLPVVADFPVAIGFARDDGLDALFFEKGPDRIGVVAFVGEEFFDARDEAHAFFRHHAIGSIAGRQNEGPRPAEFVDDCVNLAVLATFREPDRLKLGPPLWMARPSLRGHRYSVAALSSEGRTPWKSQFWASI